MWACVVFVALCAAAPASFKYDRTVEHVPLASSYVSKNVSFASSAPSGLLQIQATLTTPQDTTGSLPAVVFIGGSGAPNRNEAGEQPIFNFMIPKKPQCFSSVFSAVPFQDLARGFAAQGIVSLRYDKRTCLSPACAYLPKDFDFSKLTALDLAIDAASAIDYLSTLPFVDLTKVTVIGHSQGSGIVLPAIKLAQKVRATRAIQLMGIAIDWSILTLQQALANNIVATQGQAACLVENQTAAANQFATGASQGWTQFEQTLFPFASKLHDGSLSPTAPFQCVTPNNCITFEFLYSLQNYTGLVAQEEHMSDFVNSGNQLLTLNSMQDTLVTPQLFASIQSIAFESDSAELFPNIVHLLIPSDGSSPNVDPKLTARLAKFITAGK